MTLLQAGRTHSYQKLKAGREPWRSARQAGAFWAPNRTRFHRRLQPASAVEYLQCEGAASSISPSLHSALRRAADAI